ncbi:MAG: type II toxin-antitoxin system prevent-host-death family antitoxin [Actinomycetes bacterium]|jgi:prevent-host-death family protein|nr:type II toxin-antitoxin system prevent-host-death family antitoxin [Actinomycetes bacterium]
MDATATELKNNLGYYLKLVEDEDVRVYKNGRYVARLSSPREERIEQARGLFGIISPATDISDIQAQRRVKYEDPA